MKVERGAILSPPSPPMYRAITFASMNDETRFAINRATDAVTMKEVFTITDTVRTITGGLPFDAVYRAIERSIDANQ